MSELRDLPLREFRPIPMVRRELTALPERPPSSIVDAHNHLGRWLTGDWSVPDVGALLASMGSTRKQAAPRTTRSRPTPTLR